MSIIYLYNKSIVRFIDNNKISKTVINRSEANYKCNLIILLNLESVSYSILFKKKQNLNSHLHYHEPFFLNFEKI